jgi:prepilin-type N-terminal cleavage/methylation domain-containing protein
MNVTTSNVSKQQSRGFTLVECMATLAVMALALAMIAGMVETSGKQSAAANRSTGAWLALRTVQARIQNPALDLSSSNTVSDQVIAEFNFRSDGQETSGQDDHAVWVVQLKSAPAAAGSIPWLETFHAEVRSIAQQKVIASTVLQRVHPTSASHATVAAQR